MGTAPDSAQRQNESPIDISNAAGVGLGAFRTNPTIPSGHDPLAGEHRQRRHGSNRSRTERQRSQASESGEEVILGPELREGTRGAGPRFSRFHSKHSADRHAAKGGPSAAPAFASPRTTVKRTKRLTFD